MRPVRNRLVINGKKPSPSSSEEKLVQEPVEVFCRLRTHTEYTNSCIALHSPTQLTLLPPDDLKNRKSVQYGFNYIFTEHARQKEIFDHVAMPLLKGLLLGKNGLLFTYGVTGSGKTYTMAGETNDPGISPRCINMLFNTIGPYQTPKYVVKSDKMNGFEVQSECDALDECIRDSKYKRKFTKKNTENSLIYYNDGSKVSHIDDSCSYTVFVSYVEIYNNLVYDLLDEGSHTRSLQAKIVREDCNHNIYVNGIVEVEVKSAEEALELYGTGKRRKRMAQTSLNTESSRSHSIFTIRLVIMPQCSKAKHLLNIAQLSLVDLAGSERCSRTQTTGQRLKEAGSINNSLMSLRTCLEILRENQKTGICRIVPYRESRLTHLFKNFFEGEGKVKMIICANPSAKDYDETVHVMKFAELTREVRVARSEIKIPETPKYTLPETPSTRSSSASVSIQTDPDHFELFRSRRIANFPRVSSFDPESDEIKSLIMYLKRRKQYLRSGQGIKKRCDKFRGKLVHLQESKSYYEKQLNCLMPMERQKVKDLKNKLVDLEVNGDKIREECAKKDVLIENLQHTINEKNFQIRQSMLDKAKHKQKCEQVSEKMTHELDQKLRRQRDYMTSAMNKKLEKLELVKDIIMSDKTTTNVYFDKENEKQAEEPQSEHISRRNTPVANPRYRRTSSADGRWLKHTQNQPTPLGTVLQPLIKCNKSVNKLTNIKDVVNPKQSKYLLISQGQGDVGELETKLYKGDIIPTCCGGAQVIFDDVEKLTQESPTNPNTSLRKRAKSTSDNLFESEGKKQKKYFQ